MGEVIRKKKTTCFFAYQEDHHEILPVPLSVPLLKCFSSFLQRRDVARLGGMMKGRYIRFTIGGDPLPRICSMFAASYSCASKHGQNVFWKGFNHLLTTSMYIKVASTAENITEIQISQ